MSQTFKSSSYIVRAVVAYLVPGGVERSWDPSMQVVGTFSSRKHARTSCPAHESLRDVAAPPDGFGADAVQTAMVEAMSRLPDELRQTLTWDQGFEMANHAQIAAATDLDIYFCDPHSPWHRGSNENTIGLLCQYFPRAPA